MKFRYFLKAMRRIFKQTGQLSFWGASWYALFIYKEFLRKRRRQIEGNGKHDVVLLALPLSSTSRPPIGLAYLKSYLKQNKISCLCIDYNIRLYKKIKNSKKYPYNSLDFIFMDEKKMSGFFDEKFKEILDAWVTEIIEINPKYLGVSVNSKLVYPPLKYIADSLRSSNPAIKVILGGPVCMQDGHGLIEKHYGDIVIKSEGEAAFLEVINALNANQPLNNIKGILYKNGEEMIDTGQTKYVGNLDVLPFPDYDDFPLGEYEREAFGFYAKLPIMGSRGCPAHCDFCNIDFLWGKYRARSAQNIFDEMKYLKSKYGIIVFYFNDSLLNANPKALEELCLLIQKSGELFLWNGMYRIWNKPMPKDFFKLLLNAGCNALSIGIESGSEEIRRQMDKPFTNATAHEELLHMHEAGIHTHVMLLVGYPSETETQFQETLDFVSKNKDYIDSVTFGFTCLIVEGTPIWKKREGYEVKYDDTGNWYVGNNTLDERLRRVAEGNKFAKTLGIRINQ